MTTRSAANPLPSEFDDATFGHRLALGAVVGIPVIFVLTLLVAAAGAGWGSALLIAGWAAIVGGPFAGGLVAVMTGSTDTGTAEVRELQPRRPGEHGADRRHAA